MNAKNIFVALIIGMLSFTSMKAQEMNHSKMKKEASKMEKKESYACPMKCEGAKTYDKEGKCPTCNMKLQKLKMKAVYTCSMHPEVVSRNQGKCPKCSMKLIEKKMDIKKEVEDAHKGHNHH